MNTQLKLLNTPELIDTVAGWLADQRNYQWLDFGNGVQQLSAVAVKIMAQKDMHALRAFTAEDGTPIGVVGLSNIDRNFKTATIWIALGDKRYNLKGYALRAAWQILAYGFHELGLQMISAWAVECNEASQRIIHRLGFRPVGRLRRCHVIDGRVYDRLLFDMLPDELADVGEHTAEHREIGHG
ncbi:MAG: GNAT family N-acetyltransferase [Sulfurifustaceae bacterium]